MNAALCSCRVRTSLIEELRRLSTMSRFSSPGTPKIRSTPSFSSAATIRSDPLGMASSHLLPCNRLSAGHGNSVNTIAPLRRREPWPPALHDLRDARTRRERDHGPLVVEPPWAHYWIDR